ncbi:hypothetical protein [Streptomyces chiangmaiensis]|uniref:Uncharacterized protein n=1 Tax=Streptomyces chiangmaiensis TaxID=766497 RepID=A0ABU7FQ96_9ACTN|nr:hypothetical protein [Streptomyces chiangmaiensis]MED7826111.1 hypothetical protein [Streptomyces chiangmaiensis]
MRNIRRAGYTAGALSAAYAGYYTVLYLTRWEWQRALISAVLLVIVEVFLATVMLLTRFSRLENRLAEFEARAEDVRSRLEQTRTPTPNRFAWLASTDPDTLNGTPRTFVFVPVLMVAGAVLSALAVVIQKIAGASAGPDAERRLAARLTALTAPPVHEADSLEERPAIAPARPGRRALTVTVAAASLPLTLVLWSALADATQTRPERTPDASSTTLVFEVAIQGERNPHVVQLAANDLWETCRRSTAARNDKAGLQRMGDRLFAGVVSPALPPHDVMRLRGCIQDANTHRTSAVVLD